MWRRASGEGERQAAGVLTSSVDRARWAPSWGPDRLSHGSRCVTGPPSTSARSSRGRVRLGTRGVGRSASSASLVSAGARWCAGCTERGPRGGETGSFIGEIRRRPCTASALAALRPPGQRASERYSLPGSPRTTLPTLPLLFVSSSCHTLGQRQVNRQGRAEGGSSCAIRRQRAGGSKGLWAVHGACGKQVRHARRAQGRRAGTDA